MSHHFQHLGKTWTIAPRRPGGPLYFGPPWGDHKQKVWHCLKDKTTGRPLTLAQAEQAARDLITARFKDPDQYTRLREAARLRSGQTVGAIIDHYIAAKCPDRDKQPRSAAAQATEIRHCETLRKWWGPKTIPSLTDADQDDYHTWRLQTVRQGTGHRTTELELATLRNAMAWAHRTRKIEHLPFEKTYRFRNPTAVHHAREYMPRSADELHTIAAHLFNDPATVVYAWQTLLEAFTGLRDAETRQLRAAPPRLDPIGRPPAGHIDDRYLHVVRVKNGKNPKIPLDDPTRPEIRSLLQRILQWHAANHPHSPWLLPRPEDGAQLTKGQYTKQLLKTASALGLPPRKGHGLRAYYTSARLAQGMTPEDIARELGQGSGDELVRSTYGVEPDDFDADHWRALAPIFTWLPTAAVAPAWHRLPSHPTNIVAL